MRHHAAPLAGLKRRIVVYPSGPVLRTDDGIEVMPFVALARCWLRAGCRLDGLVRIAPAQLSRFRDDCAGAI